MKRISTMLLVVFVVSISHAASVIWNSGTLYVPNGDGTFSATPVGSGSAYSCVMYVYTDAGGTTLASGIAGNTDASTSAASVLNGTATGFTPSGVYYGKLVIVSTDGNWQQVSSIAQFTELSSGSASLNFLSGAGFDSAGNKMPTQWTAVPEPTSMALFGLGAAVLGLRRRFKKKA